VPVGAHLTVSMLGISKSGNIDTLFASYDSSSVNLQNISAVKYPNAQLIFNLAANSSLASPVIGDWNIKAQSPPELVLSQNTVSLEKSTLQEGQIINVGASVYNAGLSAADSVSISILTDDSGPLRSLKKTIAPVINPQDSVHVQVEYDSRGIRGSHSFTFQADPNNVITELYKSNNTVVVPYTVLTDTTSPSVDVTFDNTHVMDGDYIRSEPVVIFQVRDPNGALITQSDSSNIYIELDGNQQYYAGNTALQFTTGTPPVIAEVRWTPQLTDGEHTVRYYAKDAAGNSSDTTLLSVKVTNTLQISEVYNIPNPFASGTTFSFILAGKDDPQSAHIKIYTVAGRLIQDLDFSSMVHIGINGYNGSNDNLNWNGRDKDGDEIANGVYFYRVVIKGNGQETAATQKLVKMR
ncbi:MAG: CARDB domain-containing protein, partial [Bacteroidota bacterium]